MIELFSPAKLNLFFSVLNKRKDGFHEIASLYQAISLGDFLSFELSKKDEFAVNSSNLPTDKKNLVIKAKDLFSQKLGKNITAKIYLEKNIPIEAGLGGGSSNAATTLWALNELTGKPFGLSDLIEMGSALGADVPFFFSHGLAYCKGKGDQCESLNEDFDFEADLFTPDFGVPTEKVYAALKLSQLESKNPDQALSGILSGEPAYFNDLEPAAFQVAFDLAIVKADLLKYYDLVMLTGSGSSFFCMSPKEGKSKPGVIQVNGIRRKKDTWYSL